VKVSTQQLPESQVLLEIELDAEQMEQSMDRAYKKLVQRVDIPGFRKGKTPRNMLERHLGRGRLLEEAIDIAVPEAYNKALETEDIDAIGQPNIELTSAEPLAFKATVPVRPTVELGDYKALRVERKAADVDEADVQASLDELRRRYAVHEPADRSVKVGDIVRADVRIVVEDREVYKDDDAELQLREEQIVLLPGFREAIVGAKKGESKEFELEIPEDAGGAIAGKKAKVSATIKEVKEERLPDADNEFAKTVGEGFESIDALTERLRTDIRDRIEAEAEDEFRNNALLALTDNATKIEYPPVLVEREIDHFLQEQARSTGMELERYLELIKRSEEEVREDLRPSATERVRRSLAASQLSEDEAIRVEEADIDAEIESVVAQASAGNEEQAGRYRQIFGSPEARASLGRSLLSKKTMDRLIEIVSQEDGVKPARGKAEGKAKSKAAKGEKVGVSASTQQSEASEAEEAS
jgi:trigger factor